MWIVRAKGSLESRQTPDCPSARRLAEEMRAGGREAVIAAPDAKNQPTYRWSHVYRDYFDEKTGRALPC